MAFTNIGSTESEQTSVSSATTTVTVAVPDLAANSIGFVCVGVHAGTPTISSVTWDGVSMTEGANSSNAGRKSKIFYLANPGDNGNKDIVVTFSSAEIRTSHIVVGWADAGGAVTKDDDSVGSGTSQNPAITSTQAGANELVVSWSVSAANLVGTPTTTDCTELQNFDSGGNCSIAAYSIPAGSGDATHTHNYGASDVYVMCSISFKEAVTAAVQAIQHFMRTNKFF